MSELHRPSLRCALIGADTLLIECGQMLRDRGHEIAAVAAGSSRVTEWAREIGVPVCDANALEQWADELRERSVDYVFAITHLALLPTSVIDACRSMAINFHDGPLPAYAGLNTPVWGLLRDEDEWGITWHRIDEGVDTGDVLVQRRFAIAARETALSLNTRNFEEAIESFGEVLDLLESGPVDTRSHPATVARATFRRSDRPDGVLDFNRSAVEVDRVIRALHFGPHRNPMAAAVIWHPMAAVVVDSSEVVESSDISAQPGTLLTVDDDSLTVACSTGPVRLGDLRWLDGRRCTGFEFADAVGIKIGESLPMLTDGQRQWLADSAVTTQRAEEKMVASLSALTAAEFPWPTSAAQTSTAGRASVSVPLNREARLDEMVAALAVLLARLTPVGGSHVTLAQPSVPEFARPLICTEAPLDLTIDLAASSSQVLTMVGELLAPSEAGSWQRDLVARTPRLAGLPESSASLDLPIGIRRSRDDAQLPRAIAVLQPSAAGGWEVEFDTAIVQRIDAEAYAQCLASTAAELGDGEAVPAEVDLLSAPARERVVHHWNRTDAPYEAACIHDLIANQAARAPQQRAILCGNDVLTYQELISRSSSLAAHLQQLGVGPDSLVGVHVGRSVDLVVAVLAVLQAGGAYVPLDPSYPAERLRHMIADCGARVIICQLDDRDRLPLPADRVNRMVVTVDGQYDNTASLSKSVQPHNLAYCIYTSGSAGEPKGVLVEHRNVANLFAAMDPLVPHSDDSTWFAVTSLSFDISVLELLYTLARGIRIALHAPDARHRVAQSKAMQFSLFYFSADESSDTSSSAGGKYRLLLEGARFADANGFCAVWTPERHFHAFGGLYPNPAVTAAAIATHTERVAIRAGSVVLPLHHPVEIAEAWSMVDNLSNGRVGIAFASGWQPNDFVLRPQNYSNAKTVMFEGIEQIRKLWRGDTVTFDGPDNEPFDVAILPRPVQAELPTWITTAGHPDSFAAAGSIGANLLTHLVGQSIDQLAAKISIYREARAAAGHDPATGVVSLMLHTFVGDDEQHVRAAVRDPLRRYLNTSFDLIREHAWSFPTFRKPDGAVIANANDMFDMADDDIASLAGDDLDAVLDHAADRYYETSGLFGTPEHVLPRVEQLHQIGVDEIACLLDFGVATDTVLSNLPHLARLREMAANSPTRKPSPAGDVSIAELVTAAGTTHLQCTPSMARMLTLDPAMRKAFGKIEHLLVGGETLPTDLARELQSLVGGTVTNMYGPTETTVWSSAWRVQPGFDRTPIGSPLANTQLYVLDNVGQPAPPGVAGQLWIGGDGVARGYHRRPDLTLDRFRANPFRDQGRMYSTGDIARWRADADGCATLEFLGRIDQQVKLRGHRIELGEIEAELRLLDGVIECAVVIHQADGDAFEQQLAAYVVVDEPSFTPTTARETLRRRLPEVMVPGHIVVLPTLPRTPNGKIDRRSLYAQPRVATTKAAASPASSDLQHRVLASWRQVLGDASGQLGIDDNFFDAGGHSLLVVRLHRLLQETFGRDVALTDLYRFPTVRTFAASLAPSAKSSAVAEALDRAARRRATSRGGS